MAEKTLAQEIITLIQSYANNNPAPQSCEIVKTYEDGYVDAVTYEDYYEYVEVFGDNTVGNKGIICFIDGDETKQKIITADAIHDLSDYIKKSDITGLIKNDGTIDTNQYLTNASLTGYVTSTELNMILSSYVTTGTLEDYALKSELFSGDYNDLTNKPSIPASSSDLTDGNDLIKKSNTAGLIKNDGSIDTTVYSTFSGSYVDLTNKPTIPSKTSDLTNDGDGTNVFIKDNDSRLSDARTPTSHSHAIADVSNLQSELNGKSSTSHNHDLIDGGVSGTTLLNDTDGIYATAMNDRIIYDWSDTDLVYYDADGNGAVADNEIARVGHSHSWVEISSSTTAPTTYHLYVNSAIRLAELIIQHKDPNAYSGTTNIGLNVGSSYKPLGIAVRMTNKENIRLGVATTGDVYIYGSVNANTNVQASIMWHY